jgi:Luciferase
VWHSLHGDGRVDYHPVFPGRPGFGARAIETEADIDDVIALMRLNYERIVARHGVPGQAAA